MNADERRFIAAVCVFPRLWSFLGEDSELHIPMLSDPKGRVAKQAQSVSEIHPVAVFLSYLRVISSAINSACFSTVSVASACISGG